MFFRNCLLNMSSHSQCFQQVPGPNRSHPLCNLVCLIKIRESSLMPVLSRTSSAGFYFQDCCEQNWTPREDQTSFQATYKIWKAIKAITRFNYRKQMQLTKTSLDGSQNLVKGQAVNSNDEVWIGLKLMLIYTS